MDELKKSRRRRGGQDGNQNALKHGFYAQTFREGEFADLAQADPKGLSDEIAMLRVTIRRMFEMTSEAGTLKEWVSTLNALGLAAGRLATLLVAQDKLSGEQGDSSAELAEAIRLAVEEVVGE